MKESRRIRGSDGGAANPVASTWRLCAVLFSLVLLLQSVSTAESGQERGGATISLEAVSGTLDSVDPSIPLRVSFVVSRGLTSEALTSWIFGMVLICDATCSIDSLLSPELETSSEGSASVDAVHPRLGRVRFSLSPQTGPMTFHRTESHSTTLCREEDDFRMISWFILWATSSTELPEQGIWTGVGSGVLGPRDLTGTATSIRGAVAEYSMGWREEACG